MYRIAMIALALALLVASAAELAQAQRRGGFRGSQQESENAPPASPPGMRGGRGNDAQGGRAGGFGRGGFGHGGGAASNPLFAALDKNQDGNLSSEELSQAAAVLKTLDADKDGVLSLTECAPAGGGHGHGSAGRPSPQEETSANVEALMAFDKNEDDVLIAEELPERMQNLIERADTDGDGKVTRLELSKMAQAEAGLPAGGRSGFGGGRGRGRFAAPATRPADQP